MAKGMSMKVLLQLQTKEFQKGINSIKKQLNGFKSFMKSAFALGSVTMFGRQMIQVSKDFENAMARVQSVSNASTDEFIKMRKEAERLGSTTRYTATEAAEALENLTRNGMSATNATKSLSSVLQLAQANSISLADAANIVTNTLNMFNLGVNQASRVNDVLSSTASHAATDITSLYEAMVNAAPAANVLGFSLEETASAIGALAQRGVKGAEAGTKLRIAFQKMADPKVIAKMKAQGIEIDENTMRAEGLMKTIQKLSAAKLSLGDLGRIFDAKSAMAVQMLTASLEDLDYMLDVTANSAGETERMFNQSVGSVQQELDTLKSMYEGMLISMGQKTSGMVKGVVKLLQNLIINFETVGGTIMNIASVVVPLLTKRVITMAQTMKTAFTQIAAGATTVKAALGGWISIIATLVTWIGTALVGAWNRAHKAMKDATNQLAEAQAEATKMHRAVENLKAKIGDGSDKGSLTSALKEATRLFPEFASAINNAKRIAEKTGEWEKLKEVLQDIADLQSLVTTRDAKKAVAEAQAGQVANTMWGDTSWWKGGGANTDEYGYLMSESYKNSGEANNTVAKQIRQSLKDTGFSKEAQKEIFNQMAKILATSSSFDDGVGEIKKLLKDYNVDVNEDALTRWLDSYNPNSPNSSFYNNKRKGRVSDAQQTNREIAQIDSTAQVKSYNFLKKDFDNIEQNTKDELGDISKHQDEYNERMYEAASDFFDKVVDLGLSPDSPQMKEAIDILNKYPKPQPKPDTSGGGGNKGGSTSKVKTDADNIKDAIDDYTEGTNKLNNRLAAGTITQEEYNSEMEKLVDNTWEAITSFAAFRDILAQLGQTGLGSQLESAYGDNRTAEKNKATSAAFKEATDKIQEQYKNLGGYWFPQKQSRDTRFDYAKSKSDIAREEVDIEFNFAEGLDKLAKDLQAAIDSGDFDGIKEDAVDQLNMLKEAAKEASKEAETLQHKLNLSEAIATLDSQIAELKSKQLDNITSVANAFDNLYRSIQSVSEQFGDKIEWEGFEKFMAILNFGVQVFETLKTVMQAVQVVEDLMAKKKAANAAKIIAANEAATASEIEKGAAAAGAAAAEGAESVAGVPVVGPALAVAAAAAIAGAILLAMGKFANGGIVGGNSYSGDRQLARVNSGEMILNKGQQATLFNAINNGALGGGNVEFKIRGADLVGTLNNYGRLRK